MKSRKDHLVELAAAALGSVAEDVSRNAWDHVKYIMDSIDDASEPAQEAPRSAIDAELFDALTADNYMGWIMPDTWDAPGNKRRATALRAWYEHHKERRFWDGDASNEEHRRSDAAEGEKAQSVGLQSAPVQQTSGPALPDERVTPRNASDGVARSGPSRETTDHQGARSEPSPDPVRARLVAERDAADRWSELGEYGPHWCDSSAQELREAAVDGNPSDYTTNFVAFARAELALREYDERKAKERGSDCKNDALGYYTFDGSTPPKQVYHEFDKSKHVVEPDPVTKAALELAEFYLAASISLRDQSDGALRSAFDGGDQLVAYRRAVRERDAAKAVAP